MTFTDSIEYTVTADPMQGIALFHPDAPDAASTFEFGNIGRSELLAVGAMAQVYLTEVYPEVYFAQAESSSVELNITVPFSPSHDAEVESLRTWVTRRKALWYKDNRGRLLHGVLTGITIADAEVGSQVTGTLIVSDA